jgi:CubicO group peptidase (beta-lactamase class C family)
MSAADGSPERGFDWRAWLPEFIYEFFFDAPADPSAASVAEAAPYAPLDPLSALLEASALSQDRTAEWPAVTFDLDRELHRRREAAAGLVLLEDTRALVPLANTRPFQLVLPALGDFSAFEDFANRYAPYERRRWASEAETLPGLRSLPGEMPVVVLIDDAFGAPLADNAWWKPLLALRHTHPLILVHFGAARTLEDLPDELTVLHAVLGDAINQEYAAQALFGGQAITGVLTDPIGARFPAGAGLERRATRLGYTAPEMLGIDRRELAAIDRVMDWARRRRATPGGQVLVAKEGQIIYEQAFGYQTYRRRVPVRVSDLYDLASVTKAAATTLSLMKLYETDRIRIDDRLGELVPAYAESPARQLSLDQLLAHHTGLQTNIPANEYLWRYRELFATERSDSFPYPLGPNRFVAREVVEGIQRNLTQLHPARRPYYQYSDANFALLRDVVEAVSQRTLDDYLREEIAEPLGLRRFVFNPAYLYPADHLVPAGVDNWIRGGELRGFVHDESAALLGGVAGHAGLFSNAHDLAEVFQLLLNRGYYAGQTLLSPATVELFTRRNLYNHRALGFERLQASVPSVVRAGASEATFGHTGFVGTCVWADPEHNLVYVFLSNRTYPDSKNEQLIKMGVREKIHRIIYRSLNSYPAEAA